MRWWTLLLIGGAITTIALGVGLVTVQVVDDSASGSGVELIIAGTAVVVLVAVLGFLAGWFGRDHDDVVVVAVGVGLSGALVLAVGSLFSDDWRIGSAVLGIGVAIVAAAISRLTWWIGDAICDLRGLPNQFQLLSPAFPEEYPGVTLWTTDAGPALRGTLDALADRVAPGAPVDARAVGILAALPRERPVAIALAGDRLAIQPVDLAGAPIDEPTTLVPEQLADVSIRSQAADGSIRKQINAHDDVVDICTVDGDRLRLRLAYGTRGAGTATGGPDEIRTWLRTNAAAYR